MGRLTGIYFVSRDGMQSKENPHLHVEREHLRKENERRTQKMKVEKKGKGGKVKADKKEEEKIKRTRRGLKALREISKIPKQYGITNLEVTFPKSGQGNYTKDKRGFVTTINGNNGFTRSRGNFSDWFIGTIQPLCTLHTKRVMIMPKDIQLARHIRGDV